MAVIDVVISVHHTMRQIPLAVGSTATVSSGIASGSLTAGDIGGLIGGIASAVGLIVTILVYNAKRNREYFTELDAEYDRGRDSVATEVEALRRDMEYWRGVAVGMLRQQGQPIPLPPSSNEGDG